MTTNTSDKRFVLYTVLLSSFSGPLLLSATNVALPTIGTDLNMNALQLSWVSQAFTLALIICTLPLGRLGDITGRKKLYTIGSIVFSLASLGSGLAQSALVLISLRVVQGVALAMVWGTATALLANVYPQNERGRVLGLNVAVIFLAISLGPTIGGVLTQHLGWRSVFFITILLQIPVIVLLLKKVKTEFADAKGEKYDIVGSLLFATMLFFIMYGFTSVTTIPGILLIIFGIILLATFVVWELKTEVPMFNIRFLTHNKLFAFSNLAQLLFYSSSYPVTFVVSLYIQYIRGLSPQEAGFVLLAQPVIQATFSPIAGRISDRVQPRLIGSLGFIVLLTGLLLLLYSIGDKPLFLIVLSLLLIGFGNALFASPNTNAIMGSVEQKHYGVASASQATSRDVGITFGTGVLMLFFSLYMGTAQITPEYYGAFVESIRMAIMIFSLICFAGVFVSAMRGKIVPIAGQ